MDWIKAKYDRLLLGLLGVIALLVGGLLVSKVLGFKGNFAKRPDMVEKSNFGTDEAGKKLEAAKALLAAEAQVTPPKFKNIDISLFTSFPVLKTADGKVINILDPDSEQVRPPIANDWLYKNDLDITRTDIADLDLDGDGFTNAEEFIGKTNPRDKENAPPFTGKLAYKECVKDPLTLKFAIDGGDQEITIRRTEPAATAFNNLVAVGGEFPAEKGSKEMRFKLTKVDRSATKPVAILDDLSTKDKVEDIKIELGGTVEMPGRSAKIVCSLGTPEERIFKEGDEVSFAANPDLKFTVKKVTDEEVTLEYTPPGATEKKLHTLKLPPPS